MAASSVPHVVLVHGAWHGAWCWAALQSELDRLGVPSLAVDLPGHGASLEPLADLAADAALVTGVLSRIDGPVVLVGHSYGGAVITEASDTASNVAHLVYVAAFVPDVGETVIGMSQTLPPAESLLSKAMVVDGVTSTVVPELAHGAFYGHCDPTASATFTARLSAQPFATFTQPLTAAGWKSIPSTYIRCTDDQAIPIIQQDEMAKRCTTIETLDTDHSPFASMPAETAGIIAAIARSM